MKRIKSNIGNNQKSNSKDVIQIKKTLKAIGIYEGDINSPYIDQELDRSIRKFQTLSKVKADGLITPDGETEKAIIRLTAKSPQMRFSKCGGFHGGSKGGYCPQCTVKM